MKRILSSKQPEVARGLRTFVQARLGDEFWACVNVVVDKSYFILQSPMFLFLPCLFFPLHYSPFPHFTVNSLPSLCTTFSLVFLHLSSLSPFNSLTNVSLPLFPGYPSPSDTPLPRIPLSPGYPSLPDIPLPRIKLSHGYRSPSDILYPGYPSALDTPSPPDTPLPDKWKQYSSLHLTEIKHNERLRSIIRNSLQPVENPDTVLYPLDNWYESPEDSACALPLTGKSTGEGKTSSWYC